MEMTEEQRDFLLSEQGHLTHLIEVTRSPSSRLSLESRLQEVRNQLDSIQPVPRTPYSSIVFEGSPVISNRGIEASFAAQATLDYIDSVYLLGLDHEGLLGTTGRIPESPDRHKLLITGVTRGSFGFRLEGASREPAAEEAVGRAMRRANEILNVTQSDNETALQLLAETPARVVRPMHSFARRVANADATCNVVRGSEEFIFRQPRHAESLLRLFSPSTREGQSSTIQMAQEVRFLGRFQGFLSVSREAQVELVEPWEEDDALLLAPLGKVSYKVRLEKTLNLDFGDILGRLVLITAQFLGTNRNPRFRINGVDVRAAELRNQYPLHLQI